MPSLPVTAAALQFFHDLCNPEGDYFITAPIKPLFLASTALNASLWPFAYTGEPW